MNPSGAEGFFHIVIVVCDDGNHAVSDDQQVCFNLSVDVIPVNRN